MKIKEVEFNDKQLNELEYMGIDTYPYDDCEKKHKLKILVLNNWDVRDMSKCFTEYLNHKGDVFDTAINWFQKCTKEVFMVSYVQAKYPENYDLIEYDEISLYLPVEGFTATRESTRNELKKFLERFNYYDEFRQEESHIEECNKCFFRVENNW